MIIPLYPDLTVANDDEKCSRENFVERVHIPTLQVFRAADSSRPSPAIIICPGGGYQGISIENEGRQVAAYLSTTLGITAFVLKYRLPPTYRHPVPLNDAQHAIKLVRSRAKEFNIKPDSIGVMGFSAGGHLASALATAGETRDENSSDPIAQQSSRPDFAMLIYPVISMHTPETHTGSRDNLLTPQASVTQRTSVSTELRVTRDTPPTFLLTAMDDDMVSPQNSIAFHAALQRSGVPAELHLLPTGGHGFGMRDPQLCEQWLTRLKWWLEKQKILT